MNVWRSGCVTAQLNFSCERASTATCYHALLWWRCAVPARRTGQIELLAKRHGMPRVVIVDAKTVVCVNSIGNVARLSDAEAIYQAEPHARHLAACTKRETCQQHERTSKRHRSNEKEISHGRVS